MADGEAKKGKERPYWLPFVIAFVMLIILTLFFFRPEVLELFPTGFTFTEWVTVGYIVTVLMFVWLFVWKITLDTDVTPEAAEVVERPSEEAKAKPRTEEEEEAPPRPRKKRVVVAAGSAADKAGHDDELPEGLRRPEDVIDEDVEDMEDMPRVVEIPEKEPGGVYSDTLLKVDENLVLNYRTLLGKVCHNCEELEDCKKRVAGKLDEEVFLYNFECKDGIKAELNRARKKREAEQEKADAAKRMVEDRAAEAKEGDEEEDAEEEDAEEGPPKRKAPKKDAPKKGETKKTTPGKKKTTPGKKKTTPGKKRTTPGKKKAAPGKKRTGASKGKGKRSSSASKKKGTGADK